MGKQFLAWMSAGIAGFLVIGLQAVQAGNVSLKSIVSAVIAAVLVRAANFVVAYFGPKPAV